MSMQSDHEREKLELLELYAPRRPMARLPKQYRVTETNPKPPLVHFAISASAAVLYKYAEEHHLTEYLDNFPNIVSPVTVFTATERLSEEVEYEIDFNWPLKPTADCGVILTLFNNYTIEDKLLIEEDQEDVIQMVCEALDLDKSIRPKWYFDYMIRGSQTINGRIQRYLPPLYR